MSDRKHISLVAPCYNEKDNIPELFDRVRAAMSAFPQYTWDLLLIDNSSTDGTIEVIREMSKRHAELRAIINARNFGHIRSPHHALCQTDADATIFLASDLQDPPELIPDFIRKWEHGAKIVVAVKQQEESSFVIKYVRKFYYRLLDRLADVPVIKDFTGFGLYDRVVMDALKTMNDPYPYFRGMLSEIGYSIETIPFFKPMRKRGLTKNNFYSLYDMAMLGITSHSKVPLRLATLAGFTLSAFSLLVSVVYLVMKLIYWDRFTAGMAPVLIGVFFFLSVQLFFIGLLGEYVGWIFTHVKNRPHVFERERIGFDKKPAQGK